MSASPFRAMSPQLSPPRAQQSKIQDIRSRIIRSNVEAKQRSPLKPSLRHDRSPVLPGPSSTPAPFPPVSKNNFNNATFTGSSAKAVIPEHELEWRHPDIATIEHRIVNKELELRRVLINFLLLLVSKLAFNFSKLILLKLESPWSLDGYSSYLYLLQLLFLWNIGSGIYKVLKPQDDFKDLNLSEQQRELLGLTPVPLKTNTRSVSYKSSLGSKPSSNKPASTSTSTSTTNQPASSFTKQEQKVKTPIASPMASSPIKKFTHHTSPQKSPLRFQLNKSATNASIITTKGASTTSNTSLSNPLLSKLKEASVGSTPTYIPSPKYYYRMDSPTKARRRV